MLSAPVTSPESPLLPQLRAHPSHTPSAIASNINSISTAFTVDFWGRFRKVGEAGKVRTARISGVMAGLIGMFISILMAMVDIQSLLDYFNTILGLLSGGIGGLFMMGIFFPRIGSRAALIGFCAGTATVLWMNFCTPASFSAFMLVGDAQYVITSYSLILARRSSSASISTQS